MLKKKQAECWECVGEGKRPEWFIDLNVTWFVIVLILVFLAGVAVGT